MTPLPDLQDYIVALKEKGAGDNTVIAILRTAGWPEKDATKALSAYYESLTGRAVPVRPRSIGGPREAFVHLLGFMTLAVWSLAAGSLWFKLINIWLPDPAARPYPDPLYGMARDLASVLVAFPIFMLVMRDVWRELLRQPSQADSALRRWLTYMALLLAAGVLVGDLVVFVEHLLRGEITARFIAKVVVVLVLAGGVFWFYLRSLQPGVRGDSLRRHGRAGAAAAAAWVVLTLVFSFAEFGSPAAQRLSAADERRSEDLEAIARAIRSRWFATRATQDRVLPKTLQELPGSAALRLTDPITGEPYRYLPQDGETYELCATFQTDTTRQPPWARPIIFKIHPAGDYCFTLVAGYDDTR